KGAFTGAFNRKPGKLELVGEGTLFLDEIGELPVLCQAKLLTAIEDRVFERVGGTRTLEFSGRVIAATNRDISTEIKEGRFRKDLYYRLSTFHLRLPPLRERPEDIPVYVKWATEMYGRRRGMEIRFPNEKITEKLSQYPWPGNVRELMHHIERIALLADGSDIKSSLWLSFPSQVSEVEDNVEEDLRTALDNYKKKHITRIVSICGGNQTEAAKRLGIERTHLNRLLAEYEGRRR
ncbi:sigma 54-interacting transcriptional regulator, partial [bacterium]|nr:sigma 54-interacting transcriptional regulator [bacterium]